jgi:putative DNA primase/helicase
MSHNTDFCTESQEQNISMDTSTPKVVKFAADRADELDRQAVESSLPYGFSFDSDGWVSYLEPGEDKEEKSKRVRICSRLEIVARTRDQVNENHGRLLMFQDPDGVVHFWPMPMELLAGDGAPYRQELLSKGLRIAPGKNARQLLTNYIQCAKPAQTARCVQKTGWSPDRTAFVLSDEVIGGEGKERLIAQSLSSTKTYSSSGSLDGWQEISRLCTGNSRLTFSLSVAFAAPLLAELGLENGGFHLRGQSSSGKTTCLNVAASVWGGSDYVKQWRATANGLEGTAMAHNDGLLCLDEIAQIDSREVGKVAYMLANGVGKTRADKLGNSRKESTWKLLLLSSGEVSLSTHLAEAGKKVTAGQEVRILDIAADTGKYGCFEDLHGFSGGELFADKIKELSSLNYGVAGPEFLRYLLENKRELVKDCNKLICELVQKHVPAQSSGQVYRVCKNFALVAAAGELATSFGITGWNEGVAIEAVFTCFNDWLKGRGCTGPQEEREILSGVRLFFEQNAESRFSLWDCEEPDRESKTFKRAGFKKSENGADQFYMFQGSFKEELCVGFDQKVVERVCITNGLLMPDSKGNPKRPERVPGVGKSLRMYRFTNRVYGGEVDATA